MQHAVDQDWTRDRRKAKSHKERKSRKQPRQTLMQAVNQIANTFSRQHDMSYIEPRTQDTVLIRIGDIDLHIKPDSGTSVNVMDEYQFRVLEHRSKQIRELQSQTKIVGTLKLNAGFSLLVLPSSLSKLFIAVWSPNLVHQH